MDLLEVGRRWRFDGVNGDDPTKAAAQARAAIAVEPDEPIDDIIGLLESAGAKIFTRDFEIPKVFGFSAGHTDNGPAIAVNTSPDISIERQIFTVAHELGHLIMHGSSYGSDSDDGDDREETAANQFASYFLLPMEAYEKELISVSRAAEVLQVLLEAMRTLESEWVAVDIGE